LHFGRDAVTDQEFVESRVEMEEILRSTLWGCLGLCADGQPYVVPINYAYVEGRILFHCALEGEKLDCIRGNPNVCFTVAFQSGEVSDHPDGKHCHIDCDSVICRGQARIVEDLAERAEVLNAFSRAFNPDAEDLSAERVAGCGAVEITIREMTGRRERGGEPILWRYVPEP